jgi:antitoxin component of RelBE/YafQ-DinJ toxin-antitoxin module
MSAHAEGASVAVPAPGRIASETRKRQHQVLVRLDDTEHADATRLAAKHGLTVQALLRAGLTYFAATEAPDA